MFLTLPYHLPAVSSLLIVDSSIYGLCLRSDGTFVYIRYRSKGVLALKGSDHKMVFQAVHELMTNESLEPWGKDEKRTNKIVFIGVDLNKEALRESFTELVTPITA